MSKKLKHIYKKILKSNIGIKILSYLIFIYSCLAFKTCKWEFRNVDECYRAWDKSKNIVLIGWHGRIALMPFLKRKKDPLNALVSVHQDGAIMANYLKKFDVGITAGSSSRNAKAAAVNLMHSLQNENSICIIPDGPVGPNMKMTISPLYFARKSSKPIIAGIYSVKNSKIISKSWDQMLIPPLFSKGIFQALGPYYVPKNATDEELQKYCEKIEKEMNDALLSIDKEMGIPEVEIGKFSRKKQKKEG